MPQSRPPSPRFNFRLAALLLLVGVLFVWGMRLLGGSDGAPVEPAAGASTAAAGFDGGAAAAESTSGRATATPILVGPTAPRGMPTITWDELPSEAHTTIELIEAGGPFPYSKDGSVFQNREGLLPDEPAGYYREYTVETPGEDDRGARRIVAGEGGELYYTDDHYDSFSWVVRE